jgi:uncharacterized protein YndB with AHSA1/START domain
MNVHISPAPVRKSVVVKASPERAFSFFTGKMIRWWRPDHHIGATPLADIVLEPKLGGRWYEIGEDGATCEWGKVLAWEPPHRLVLSWQLTADWQYDADFITEVEIRFTAEDGGTRVDLEHRNLERYGDRVAPVRAALDSPDGWTGTLAAFAEATAKQS